MKWTLFFGALLMAATLGSFSARADDGAKKLIQFGWDMQSPAELEKNIEKMQTSMPFDGITIRSTHYCYTFHTKKPNEAALKADIEAFKRTKWGKFTSNFMYVTAASNVDWYDDEAWAEDGYILRNIGFCAKAAKEAGCVGILFDPEFVYWGTPPGPWKYDTQPKAKEKSFDEMAAMARKRGAAYMKAIEKEFPNPAVLTLFWGSMSEFAKANRDFDPENRANIMKKNHYGLLPAFMTGMLEAASPGTTLIDGNEGSYYYNDAKHYEDARKSIRETNDYVVPPELRAKYREQARCGAAVYADFVLSTQNSHSTATYLTPEERAKWVEHNVYWALKTSDKYVWFYNERPNWKNGSNIAKEVVPAIESARRKIAENKPLGFDVTAFVTRAWRDVSKAENRPLQVKSAKIPRLAAGVAPPKIDGDAGDSAWTKATELGAFMNYAVARRKELNGSTTARMLYDENNLYIAVHCKDPDIKSALASKMEENHIFWSGDIVELALATTPEKKAYYHIKVGIDNGRWDSLTQAGDDVYGHDSSWKGEYATAVKKDTDGWTIEIAIPWTTLKATAPKSGATLSGNLMRRTRGWPDGVQEFSSWSESRSARCPEAATFGMWILD